MYNKHVFIKLFRTIKLRRIIYWPVKRVRVCIDVWDEQPWTAGNKERKNEINHKHAGNFHSANVLTYPNGVVMEASNWANCRDASATSANGWNKQQEEQTEFPAGSCWRLSELVEAVLDMKKMFLTLKNWAFCTHPLQTWAFLFQQA